MQWWRPSLHFLMQRPYSPSRWRSTSRSAGAASVVSASSASCVSSTCAAHETPRIVVDIENTHSVAIFVQAAHDLPLGETSWSDPVHSAESGSARAGGTLIMGGGPPRVDGRGLDTLDGREAFSSQYASAGARASAGMASDRGVTAASPP